MGDAYLELLRRMAEEKGGKKSRKRPGDEEHQIQVACVHWFWYQHQNMRHKLFSVPNGGYRSPKTAAIMKEEGQLAGVSDLIFLHRTKQYGALLIEMKTPKGTQSDKQKAWQALIEPEGYKYVICHSLDEFKTEIQNYLSME